MHTLDAIRERRSVKIFDPNFKMPSADQEQLLSLALLSPTAFNIQHWRIVVVSDTNLRQQIRAAAWGQAQVTDSSLFLVLCADMQAWQKQPERYWANVDTPTREVLLPMIDNYYRDKAQVQRDEALRSCGMAAQTLMLAAKAMGYESCPMDGFDFERVGKLINLPDDHLIAMCLAIGKPLQPARPRGGQLGFSEVIIENHF